MSLFYKATADSGSAIPDTVVNNAYGWYDAENLSLNDGDSVSTRPDTSGQANDLSGNGTYEASSVNGEPSVNYDGVDDLHTVSNSAAAPMTWFVVFSWSGNTVTDSTQTILGNGGSKANRNLIGVDTGSNDWIIRVGNNSYTGGAPDSNWHVGTYKNDGSNGFARIDGTEVVSGSAGYPVDSETITIGDKKGTSDRPFDGRVAEAIFVGSDVSQSDIEQTEQSLADEYGISI